MEAPSSSLNLLLDEEPEAHAIVNTERRDATDLVEETEAHILVRLLLLWKLC